MTKITLDVPDKVTGCIGEMLKAHNETISVELPKRKLVIWALERFAQGSQSMGSVPPLDRTQTEYQVDGQGEKILSTVAIDVPDQLFNRLNTMWVDRIDSLNITLPKRKLVLWALEQFVRSNNQKYERPDPL